MAEKITVELEAKFGAIEKKLKQLDSGLKDVGKTAKKTSKGVRGIGKAVKGFGAILTGGLFKAGAVIMAKLMELFTSNQKVVDLLDIAMTSLTMAFNDLVKFVEKNAGPIIDNFKALFEDPGKMIDDLGKAIKANLIERINSAIETLGFLASAIVKVFKGDFDGALEDAKSAGKEFTDVLTGVDDSFDKIADVTEKVVKATGDYAKKTIEAATSVVEQNKAVRLAIAENEKLQFIFQRQAEQQRQIRDDVSKSIEDRIEANKKLGETLEQQQALQLKNAKLQVSQAKRNLKADKDNVAFKEALILAQKEEADVLENIEGFRSEQDVNRVALEQELLDRENAKLEGESKRFIQRKEMAAQEIEDELLRIKTLTEIAEQEKELELERLQNKIDQYKEGTQARVDAEQEFEDFKVASEQKIQGLEKQGETIKKKSAEEEKKRKKALVDAAIAQDKQTLGRIAQIAGQGSAIGKAAAVADATIKGIQGVQNAYTTAQSSPITVLFPAYPIVQAGLAAAFSADQIKSILSTPKPSASGAVGGSSVSVPAGASAPAPPAFNVVGESPENQLAQTIEGRESEPVKAFVVSSDVSSAQALDRNIIENAAIE